MPAFLAKKIAFMAVRNPEQTKKIVGVVLSILFALLLLPVIILNSISAILQDDVMLDARFDITQIAGYQKVYAIVTAYQDAINNEMNEQAESIREDNTSLVPGSDGSLMSVCSVTVDVTLNPIDIGYVLAYLSVTDENLFSDTYEPSKAQVNAFLADISQVVVSQSDDAYAIYNRICTMEEILVLLRSSDKQSFFQASYESFSDLISSNSMGGNGNGEGGVPGVSLTSCHPELIRKANQLVARCAERGYPIRITETVRSVERQDQLYAQGRTKPGNIVTNAKGSDYSSMHQWGIAFDVCRADGRGAYNEAGGYFDQVGAIGKGLGLEWGGDWSSIVDKPHFQLPTWGSSASRLKKQWGDPQSFAETWR